MAISEFSFSKTLFLNDKIHVLIRLSKHQIILLFLVGISFFTACQSDLSPEQEKQIFRYNEHANITSLDPAFAKDQRNIWPDNQLYNGLVQLDNELNIQPDLAKSWEITEKGSSYTFHLRTDVFFHKSTLFGKDSTRLMTANDVVFSLKRLSDPQLASPGSWVMRDVKSIESLNDSTVKIQLKKPFPAFLGLLSMTYCSVVPKEISTKDFLEHPVGTGPFQFKRWEPNEKLVFRKNPLYFETDSTGNRLPYLEAVAITFLPEKQSEFMQFVLGNLDFMSGLDASYKDELLTTTGDLQPKYSAQIKVKKAPYLNLEYIGLNLEDSLSETGSLQLRKALNYGFDREKMIAFLRNGIGLPGEKGVIPEGLPGNSTSTFYDYQPRKAATLIQEYKTKHRGKTPKISLATTAQYLDFCEFLQKEWQKIGIKVDVNVMPPSTLLQKRAAGQLQAFRASWIADYPDAQNYLSLFYSENFSPQGPNYTHFKSDNFDRLYKKALIQPELKNRIPLYQKMDSIVMKNAAVVPLYYDEVVRFIQKNVTGLGINPQNLLNLKRVKKE